MVWSLVQKTAGVTTFHGFTGSQSINFTSASSIGNFVFVPVFGLSLSAAPVASQFNLTDNASGGSNTYTPLFFQAGNNAPNQGVTPWVAAYGVKLPRVAGGNLTLTLTANPHSVLGMIAAEFSSDPGSLAIDGAAVTGKTGLSSSPLTLSISTSLGGDLLIASVSRYSGDNVSADETNDTIGSPSGFSVLYQNLDDFNYTAGEMDYEILSGLASGQAVTWSDSTRSIQWTGGVVAVSSLIHPDTSGSGGGGGGPWYNPIHNTWDLSGGQRPLNTPRSVTHTRSSYA